MRHGGVSTGAVRPFAVTLDMYMHGHNLKLLWEVPHSSLCVKLAAELPKLRLETIAHTPCDRLAGCGITPTVLPSPPGH